MNNASDGHHDWDTLIRRVVISSRYVCSKWVRKQLYTYQSSCIKVKCPWLFHTAGCSFTERLRYLQTNRPDIMCISLSIIHCLFCIFRVAMEYNSIPQIIFTRCSRFSSSCPSLYVFDHEYKVAH